jgi:hypothetical protein
MRNPGDAIVFSESECYDSTMQIEFSRSLDGTIWEAAAVADGAALWREEGVTPWEASAAVCAAVGSDCEIVWNELPWSEIRIAYGIVLGVLELFGATPSAQKAIGAARQEAVLQDPLCQP